MLAAAIVIAGIGLVLLPIGLRGRRTDDHPLCRRCGYDLTGKPADATRCPECGVDLTRPRATRIGHRVRRRGRVAIAVLMLFIGGIGTSLLVWARTSKFDPLPHEPLWLLRRQMTGPAAERDAVFAEVARRAAWLTADQLVPFVDEALAIQAQPTVADVPAYHLIEAARAVGKLPDGKWATYAEQAYTLALTVRPTIVAGDPLPTYFSVAGVRLDGSRFMVSSELATLSVDGRAVPLTSGQRSLADGGLDLLAASGNRATGLGGPPVPAVVTTGLSPGPHTVAATVRLAISECDPQRHGTVEIHGAKPYLPRGAIDLPVSASFSVVPQASLTFADESLRPAVESGVSVEPIRIGPGDKRVDFEMNWHHPPVRLAYAVSVRPPAGPEFPIGTFTADAMPGNTGYKKPMLDVSGIGSATHVDVIFRPAPDYVRQSRDTTPIWDGTIVVHGVPVVRGNRRPDTRPVRVDGKE